MEGRVEHLMRWAQGEVAPPVKFDIFLTNRCNLRCRFCHYPFLPEFRYENELTPGKILSLVRQAGKMGAKVFGLLGGEPFLRKETALEAMALAKRSGMSGSVVTNGTLLREDDLRRIIKMKWDLIRFSIDAPEAPLHDELRGVRGSFDKTVKAMGTLQILKRELGSSHPTVEINMVLTSRNAGLLPGMMRFAHECGVGRIYVLPVIEFGKDISDLKLRDKDGPRVSSSIEEAEEIGGELGVESNLRALRKDNLFARPNQVDTLLLEDCSFDGDVPCFLPWYGMSIDAQGWTTPCGQIETKTRINVRDYASLWDAWTGAYFTSLREDMKGRRLSRGCERCCMPMMDENVMLRKALGREGLSLAQEQNGGNAGQGK